jgi:tetratricopeptide (TPR) repeat protein
MRVVMLVYTIISLCMLTQPIVGNETRGHAPASVSPTEPAQRRHDLPGVADNTPVMPMQQPERLLLALQALDHDHEASGIAIQSPVLCFCLNKGPETIREVRQVARQWFARGLAAFQAERYDEALTAFSKAIQLHPQDARAYLNRGMTYGKMHRYGPAQADLAKAIELSPHQAEAHYASGVIWLLLGQEPQALEHFRTATRLKSYAASFSPEAF